MKKKICVALAIMATLSLAGCQATTRKLGYSATIKLEPNLKLEEITWKGASLWYLIRPMTKDDVAETHTFKESSNLGIIQDTVTVIETKE